MAKRIGIDTRKIRSPQSPALKETGGCCPRLSRKPGLAMAFKLMKSAQTKWRKPHA